MAQNYFGELIPITLSGTRNGFSVSYNIVLKLAPINEEYRVSGAVTVMFARETYVYSTLLKAYREIQQHLPIQSQYVIPKCYYVHQEYLKEAIALQDMTVEGYRPYVHDMFLDLDHTLISLKSLAKLHSLSFILQNKKPQQFEDIMTICVPLTENTNSRYMDIMKDRLDKALKKFPASEITPGNKPVSACMIDYQTTRKCSPAFDVMYLILSSTNSELRNKYLQQLMEIYYRTFEIAIKEAGISSQTLYSRQMFDSDMKVVAPACLITANTALWLSNGLQEEGHVRSKHVWSTKEEKDKAVEKYKTIITTMIDDLTNFGYISIDEL
ncbi:unnamed protein product [Spodoptera littoralis]|uniref:CHK kinase-like domain-containing protein n=1 Tax=Spodoptera littoralis TaxID=7109 RepID=A0A9P0MZN9_SPOLI|nr:unnamed protein product [Spodoptera littoralis]CAH1636066.1 unnamed protein product [Spodoptera littoralis]